MPLPLAVPIVGGLAVVTGAVLHFRKRKTLPASVANAALTQPAVTLSPVQAAAVAAPLPPAAKAVLTTRGPAPNSNDLNSLKIEMAAGTLTVNDVLKATNGTIFVKQSPQMQGQSIPDDIATQILAGDNLTVDVDGAGFQIPTIPSGNMAMIAKSVANMSDRTIQAQSSDPRVPDNGPVLTIPIRSITGISPGS